MTTYKNKVLALDAKIHEKEFYVSRWERVKNGRDLSSMCDRDLQSILNEFWDRLPDSKEIHKEPFYELCDLCDVSPPLAPTQLDMILSHGERTIEFTKQNGDYRKMFATRDMSIIRQYLPDCADLEPVYTEDTSIVVFDLVKKDWRRFMVENLIDIN